MKPSVGHLEATWTKALVVDNGSTMFCFVTVDAIGADGTIIKMAYDIAAARGFRVPFENVAMHGSHTHSGPAGITDEFLWEFAPAMDLVVPELQSLVANDLAEAMLEAQKNLQPASMGIGASVTGSCTIMRTVTFMHHHRTLAHTCRCGAAAWGHSQSPSKCESLPAQGLH